VARFEQVRAGALPPMLEKTLPRLPKIEGSFAVVCSGHTCQPPVESEEELAALLARTL
jgi:hypothetical protein